MRPRAVIGIALLKWSKLKSQPLATFCKGMILSARIYADTTGYKCPACGGVFNKRIPHSDHEEILVPKCSGCNKYPPVFHIDADAKDVNGHKIRVKIRNDQNNERLDNISQVIFTLQTIQKEIIAGEFDISRYVSKDARESFRFKNYVVAYIKHHEDRAANGELTPKALRDKKSIIKNHLIIKFGGMDLVAITANEIRLWRKTFKDNLRSKNLAVGELRTIMRQAVKDLKIRLAPEFDPIPKAKTRKNILTMDLINQTIGEIPDKRYCDMLTLMTIYPFRPSEIRALRWQDIDFIEDKINVNGHFSDEQWIDGRKSISEGEKSTMSYDVIDRARAILSDYRASRVPLMNREIDFIFKGDNGSHVRDEALGDAWRVARNKLNHTHQLYEIRHRCLTDFGKRVKGDIMKMKRFSGHTNANTLMDRYIRDDSDMREFIQ